MSIEKPDTRAWSVRSVATVITGAAFLMVVPMLTWGYAPTHDFTFHVSNWMEFARQWHEGILLPRWASHANYGFGEPRFIFYPPVANAVGGMLCLVLPAKAVPGAFVFIAVLTAGTCMFLFAREWVSREYAILAAAVYALNPYEVMLIYKRMAAAEMLASALFPLFLLFGYRAARGKRRAIFSLAILYAALWLTNAPSAVMASYSIAFLLIAIAIHERRMRPLVYVGTALALGVGLAAFYIIPAAWEQRWVDISLALTLPHNRPENNFIRLFPPRLPGGIGSIINVGAVNLTLTALVGWMAYRRRRSLPQVWKLWAIVAIFAAFFTIPLSLPFWRLLPKMIFVQLPWRWLFVVNTTCALLFVALIPTFERRTSRKVAAIPFLLFFILIGAYATKGKPGQVTDLESRIRTQGGVWPEAQYLPPGAVRGPQTDTMLVHNSDLTPTSGRMLRQTPEYVSFELEQSHPANVVLDTAWYPAWQAKVNGFKTPVQNQTGQIAVAVPAGRNTIEITFGRTWDRTLGAIASLVTLAGIGLAFLFLRVRSARLDSSKPSALEQHVRATSNTPTST